MSLSGSQLIAGLGAGQSLAEIARAAGVSETEARTTWQALVRATLPAAGATLDGKVASAVEVIRDSYGVPHVYAQTERDLFFGLGFAMAQDRLWQMDYLRRKATGRLAELLGEGYVEQDYLYRILDFRSVCSRNYDLLADRWRQVVDGMADGINRAIAQAEGNLPIEFDLLGYQPEPWSPLDILIGLRYQWWGLSGRLQGITSATILERELGDRLEAFQRLERDDLYIVPDGQNAAAVSGDPAPVRDSLYVGDQPHGSNNWVIGGVRTSSGKPLLANDPHYGYSHAHGQFYCCHLNGAGHGEAGFVFVGTPGMMTGANDRIAWGFTNNGTTIRDLYAEELNPADSGSYRRGLSWAPLATRSVEIAVKGKAPVRRTVRATARGPIVNDVIPRIGAADPPLALRWVGFEPIDDVQALLEMNTATDWTSFRAALRNWACSVTNFVYGDVDNRIGYQMSVRLPLRGVASRGIRPAGDLNHRWQGYVPFDSLPRLENPPNGIIASANQRTVNPKYPWPMYGAFAGGTRQSRILQLLRARTDHDPADFRRMQYDSKSLIAEEVMPRLLSALATTDEPRLKEAADLLASWDYCATVQTPAPAIFQTFMHRWTAAYAAATLPDQPEVRAAAGPAARRALVGEEDTPPSSELDALVVDTLRASLEDLAARFGEDPAGWTWGRVHYYSWPHPLGKVGHLGELLNGPTFPCAGTDNTINNVSPSATEPFVAGSGPVYRLIADLANPSAIYVNSHCPTLANPASPHFADTIRDWASGNYQTLYRTRALIEREAEGTTVIHPAGK
jgi:penicillin amidase